MWLRLPHFGILRCRERRPSTTSGHNVIERLMCDFEADLGKLSEEAEYDIGFLLDRNDRLAELVKDGVVMIFDGRVVVSQSTHFMVRAVAAAFDAHIGALDRKRDFRCALTATAPLNRRRIGSNIRLY